MQTTSRRNALALGAAAAATLGLSRNPAARAAQGSKTGKQAIVLIHGAWQGGWGWRLATPLLWQAGHPVTSPTLSGMGERRNVPPQDSGLQVHVQDIVEHLEMQDLRNVVLVGHSYGGCVLSGVLARNTGRVAHAVYLDAYVPQRGQALKGLLPSAEQAELDAVAAAGGAVPVPPQASWGERWGLSDPTMANWAAPRMTPQPALTFTEAVQGDPFQTPLKLTYLKCRDNPNPGFWAMARQIKADKRFNYKEIPGQHMVMLINPKAFVSQLLAVI